jgi:ABC-type Fe3+ transport system substrate-binding protein
MSRVVASDGEPIIPVLFSAYASYGDKCDKEILKMATVYLKRGADINARGAKYKNSAVVETIVRGKSEGFMFLLENGADLCLPNDLENGKSHNVMYIMTKLYEKYPDQYKALKEVVEKEYRKRC